MTCDKTGMKLLQWGGGGGGGIVALLTQLCLHPPIHPFRKTYIFHNYDFACSLFTEVLKITFLTSQTSKYPSSFTNVH